MEPRILDTSSSQTHQKLIHKVSVLSNTHFVNVKSSTGESGCQKAHPGQVLPYPVKSLPSPEPDACSNLQLLADAALQNAIKSDQRAEESVKLQKSVSMGNQLVAKDDTTTVVSPEHPTSRDMDPPTTPRKVGQANWFDYLTAYMDYVNKFGSSDVPISYHGGVGTGLGRWVHQQREEKEKFDFGEQSTMTKARIVSLNNVNFLWNHNMTKKVSLGDQIRHRVRTSHSYAKSTNNLVKKETCTKFRMPSTKKHCFSLHGRRAWEECYTRTGQDDILDPWHQTFLKKFLPVHFEGEQFSINPETRLQLIRLGYPDELIEQMPSKKAHEHLYLSRFPMARRDELSRRLQKESGEARERDVGSWIAEHRRLYKKVADSRGHTPPSETRLRDLFRLNLLQLMGVELSSA